MFYIRTDKVEYIQIYKICFRILFSKIIITIYVNNDSNKVNNYTSLIIKICFNSNFFESFFEFYFCYGNEIKIKETIGKSKNNAILFSIEFITHSNKLI